MIDSSDVVYIAGPMRNRPDYNMAEFNRIEEKLRRVFHCRVVNPARFGEILLNNYEDDIKLNNVAFQIVMSILPICNKLYLLDGWQDSKGAREEVEYALKHNITIIRHYL